MYAQFLAKLRGMEVHESDLVETQAILKSSLQALERRLKQTGWVAGTEQPTIADICLACEAEQLAMINHDMSSYPQVQEWQRSMRKLPEFNAVSGWVTWLRAASSTHDVGSFRARHTQCWTSSVRNLRSRGCDGNKKFIGVRHAPAKKDKAVQVQKRQANCWLTNTTQQTCAIKQHQHGAVQRKNKPPREALSKLHDRHHKQITSGVSCTNTRSPRDSKNAHSLPTQGAGKKLRTRAYYCPGSTRWVFIGRSLEL